LGVYYASEVIGELICTFWIL